jgi:hypothetical protein
VFSSDGHISNTVRLKKKLVWFFGILSLVARFRSQSKFKKTRTIHGRDFEREREREREEREEAEARG